MVATRIGKRVREDAAGHEFQFELHSPDFHVPRDVTDYARDKLAAKLDKFERRLVAVVVRLKDLNGTKGGVDKHCRMEAVLGGFEPVIVEERHEDLRAVLDIATDRLEDAVHRVVERARTLPRNRGRKMVRNRKVL